MGSPLGPTLANVFLCFHEKTWLDNCPLEFKPLLYRRYVDDTFVLFKNEDHAAQFLEYLNDRHQNIRFTMELENENKLAFLDLLIEKGNNKFESSVFRKKTFSGLGISFFSYCSHKFKINAIKTLLHRAFHLCSTYQYLDNEFQF